jgi:hypothetical protein
VVLVALRGFPVPSGRGAAGMRGLPATGGLGPAAFLAAIVLYVLIAALALAGGSYALHTEAVLQTILIFLGFNVAWLLLLGAGKPSYAKAGGPASRVISPYGPPVIQVAHELRAVRGRLERFPHLREKPGLLAAAGDLRAKRPRSGTRGDQPMSATLKVTHKAIEAEVRRGPYDVVLDGEQVGSFEMNDTIEIPV